MSIADGQTVLRGDAGGDVAASGVSVDARLSVSRIGSRAFPPALETLAPQIRWSSVHFAFIHLGLSEKSAGAGSSTCLKAGYASAADGVGPPAFREAVA